MKTRETSKIKVNIAKFNKVSFFCAPEYTGEYRTPDGYSAEIRCIDRLTGAAERAGGCGRMLLKEVRQGKSPFTITGM